MDILGEKRVGGEIVEQGWIVSVPWGIVPRGDLLLQRGREEKECHENPTIFKDQGLRTKDNKLWTKDQERLRTKDNGHFFYH